VHPDRHRRAEDDTVAALELQRQVLPEVLELRFVDVGAELAVKPHQPPALRQLYGEVAAALCGLPSADRAALREQPQERSQAVVPVMVARERDDHGLVIGLGQRSAKRPFQPVLVGARGRGGVDLVTTEHQQRRAGKRE
jgi:hypothetical protein